MARWLVEESVATALLTQPIRQGWVTPTSEIEFVPRLDAATVHTQSACALMGLIDAAPLFDRYAVLTDLAFVSHHVGPITLWTSDRPDAVDNVAIALGNVSLTAEAVARATVNRFYGITVTGWDRQTTSGEAAILEGVEALREPESGFSHDLIRAWFILSGYPLPTHVLVAPKAVIEQQPETLEPFIRDAHQALELGAERRREIRRDLADAMNLDRERLVQFQMDQTLTFSKTVRKAMQELLRRTGHALQLTTTEPVYVEVIPKGG